MRVVSPHCLHVGSVRLVLPNAARCDRLPGLSPLTNYTVALRQLHMAPQRTYSTSIFTSGIQLGWSVWRTFVMSWWRPSTPHICASRMPLISAGHAQEGARLSWNAGGSIDCMNWDCPTTWRGQFTSGYKGSHPTMIHEAIVDHRLWIWHAHFYVAGSNNNINVLNTLTFFTKQCKGNCPVIELTANGRRHHKSYSLRPIKDVQLFFLVCSIT